MIGRVQLSLHVIVKLMFSEFDISFWYLYSVLHSHVLYVVIYNVFSSIFLLPPVNAVC